MVDKLSWDVITTQVNSALHPSGAAKSNTSFGWSIRRESHRCRWQITLCDPIWHVISHSGEVIYTTAISICLLLNFTRPGILICNWDIPKQSTSISHLHCLMHVTHVTFCICTAHGIDRLGGSTVNACCNSGCVCSTNCLSNVMYCYIHLVVHSCCNDK